MFILLWACLSVFTDNLNYCHVASQPRWQSVCQSYVRIVTPNMPALYTQTCLDPPAPCVSFEITQAFNLYLIIPAILMKVNGIWNKIYSESQFEWGSKFTKLSAPARCYKKASILHCNSVTDWLTEIQVFCSQVTAPNHQCMVRMKRQDPILIECSSACCFISDRPSLYLDSNDWKLSRKSMKFELSSR